MSAEKAPKTGLGPDLAALSAKARAYAELQARRFPEARVRLTRPLEGPPAAAKVEALLSLESAYLGGPEPKGPYAPDLLSFRAQISDCLRCPLGSKRRALVFGEGSPTSTLAFVGGAPGYDEEAAGSPLAGAAGELFDRILSVMGFKRSGVYVCNILKCRSQGVAQDEAKALAACRPYLEHQLALVGPKVVVTLGEAAAAALLGGDEPLSVRRGRWVQSQGLRVMPTYHPRDLLRDEGLKRHVWEDLKLVLKALQPA